MAWRIHESVERGEIDNRVRGQVVGRIWIKGRSEPISLELEGDACEDLAGHLLRFHNPHATVTDHPPSASLATKQKGRAGDLTASRKVREPTCSPEELREHLRNRTPFPTRWANCLYLEWFSELNGRVVIEATDFLIALEGEPAWQMTAKEEASRQESAAAGMVEFMDRMVGVIEAAGDETLDEPPQSNAEAEADAEAARHDLLLDRIQARLGREPEADFDVVWKEERERLRRERGEPEPEPLTPEEEAAAAARIEDLNAACREAAREEPARRIEEPAIVRRLRDLSVSVHHEARNSGWLAEGDHHEHPIRELEWSLGLAGGKLAGALGSSFDDEWPPDSLIAGNVLVRLKKARECLADARRALDAIEAGRLIPLSCCQDLLRELALARDEVDCYIVEVRQILADD